MSETKRRCLARYANRESHTPCDPENCEAIAVSVAKQKVMITGRGHGDPVSPDKPSMGLKEKGEALKSAIEKVP